MVIKMSKLTIRWLGQSGYILSGGGTVICIDPYLSDIVNEAAGRPRAREIPVCPEDLRADVLICTHNHLDHVDKGAIPFMKKDKMMFCAPSDCEETLKQLGVTHYTAFDEGAKVKVGGFEISAVFADHTVPAVTHITSVCRASTRRSRIRKMRSNLPMPALVSWKRNWLRQRRQRLNSMRG